MKLNETQEKFVIVGAGISGLVLAILLSRAGHQVVLFEKRTLFESEVDGRSINLTISGRGLNVLEALGLKSSVIAQSVVLNGRIVHSTKNRSIEYKYGTKESRVLYSIRRSKLIDILLKQVALETNVEVYCGFELLNIDKTTLELSFLDKKSNTNKLFRADCVIGSDGVFSTVRNHILKTRITNFQQTVFDWGYKEFYIDRNDSERLGLKTDCIHMWPKDHSLLVAIPNPDQTFSVIFTAPLNDENNVKHNFQELVQKEYGDLLKGAPSFLSKCDLSSHQFLVSIKVDQWHIEDKIVLVGDACHATYPFYGQGMNSALEDALVLCDYINNPSLTRKEAFAAYESVRKENAKALHELCEAHLHQMTHSMVSSVWQAQDRIDFQLAKWLPKRWVYEYELIAHTNLTYINILNILKVQKRRGKMTGVFLLSYVLGMFIHFKKILS